MTVSLDAARGGSFVARKPCQRFVEEGPDTLRLRGIDFPGKGASAADPRRRAAMWQDRGGGKSNRGEDDVHIAYQFHVQSSDACIYILIHDQIEHELRVGCARRDLPDHLNEQIPVGGGNESLRICAGVCLIAADRADVVKRHVDGVPDAELVFTEQPGKVEWCGRWLGRRDGIRCIRGNCREGRGDGLRDLRIGIIFWSTG